MGGWISQNDYLRYNMKFFMFIIKVWLQGKWVGFKKAKILITEYMDDPLGNFYEWYVLYF